MLSVRSKENIPILPPPSSPTSMVDISIYGYEEATPDVVTATSPLPRCRYESPNEKNRKEYYGYGDATPDSDDVTSNTHKQQCRMPRRSSMKGNNPIVQRRASMGATTCDSSTTTTTSTIEVQLPGRNGPVRRRRLKRPSIFNASNRRYRWPKTQTPCGYKTMTMTLSLPSYSR